MSTGPLAATTGPLTGPLTGIKVVELSTMITASAAGMMLADMGADVVKVENPSGGDPFRSFGPSRDYSAHFCSYNRNKRSIAIDLRAIDGKATLATCSRMPTCCSTTFAPACSTASASRLRRSQASIPG